MDQQFDGKVALVTGGSRGIGLAIAQHLARQGASVTVTGRNAETLAQAVTDLGGEKKALGVPGKADLPEHQTEAVSAAVETFGRLDFLVNNVGINPAYGTLMDVDPQVARKTVEVNALAPLAWCQVAFHAWMEGHGGSIVNVSSLSGTTAAPGLGIYGGSKAMMEQLTRQLAQELAPSIRVNAVAPAVVKTDFAAKLYESGEDVVAQRFPLRRLGRPEDVASAVGYLLSESASWVTGQVITLDGGLRLTGGY